MAAKIHVVGLGVEAGGRLNAAAAAALGNAEVIIGTERQLDWLRGMSEAGDHWLATATLPKLSELEAMIVGYQGEIVVLASGDPLYFGIGRWLGQRYPESQLQYHGAVSSIQAACSRLGLASSIRRTRTSFTRSHPWVKLEGKGSSRSRWIAETATPT